MTVEELISILKQYPGDTPVFTENAEYGHPCKLRVNLELQSITEVIPPGTSFLTGPYFLYTKQIWPEENYEENGTFDAIVLHE